MKRLVLLSVVAVVTWVLTSTAAYAQTTGVAVAQTTPQAPRKGGGRTYEGAVTAIDPAKGAVTLQVAAGPISIAVNDETDLHVMRPGGLANITTSTYALVTGVFSQDGQSIQSTALAIYYKKGRMADYVSSRQVRGPMKAEGGKLTIQANNRAFNVNLTNPLRIIVSSPAQFSDIKVGDKVMTWAETTDIGAKAVVLYIERY